MLESVDNRTLVYLAYVGGLFVVGLAMGSFLNVVAYRLPLEMSLLHPPSACPSCGKRIPARDNLPLVGWLALGGKCRSCRKPISIRYPLVELATGLLWAAAGWRLAGMHRSFHENVALGLLELAFLSSLVVTFLVDWDHKIILDEISLGGLAVSLIASPLLPGLHRAGTEASFAARDPFLGHLLGGSPPWARGLAASFTGAAVGLLFSLLIYVLGNAAFKKKIAEARKEDPDIDSALGLGDVKLMAFFGAFLGWRAVFSIFVVGSLVGAVAGAVMKLRDGKDGGAGGWRGVKNRWASGNSVVPFGPFLSIGAVAVFFLDAPFSRIVQGWLDF